MVMTHGPIAWRQDVSQDRSRGGAKAAPADQPESGTPDGRWWSPLLRDGTRPLFVVGDVAAILLAAVLTHATPVLAGIYLVTTLGAASVAGLYKSQLNQVLLDSLPRLFRAWVIAVALLVISSQLILNKFVGLYLAALSGVLLLGLRLMSTLVVRLLRGSGMIAHGTVIVGSDASGLLIAQKIAENPQCGLTTLGFVDDEAVRVADLPAPMLGGPGDLEAILMRLQPRALIIAQSHLSEAELVGMVRACHRNRCELFVLPRLYEISNMGEDTDFLGGMPLIRLRRRAYRTWGWRIKRLVDVALSALALVVLSPVLALIALAVRLEGGGRGIIFRQERVSVDGRHFKVLKFRSMRPANDTESGTQWNISGDSRVGPVGRFIRATSLDELPQLWNILRGDMSIVGPRPERPFFVAEFDRLYGGYGARHRVPSGLTGWAQVHGLRGDTSIAERAHFDNFYIENWSLWLDFKIMLMTVSSVFSKPGS